MAVEINGVPITPVHWRPCYRIIPSRFPPIAPYDDVAAPEDRDAVFEVESLTNDRLREAAGEISLITAADRVSGSGSSWIMAPFTHLTPGGGRFTDSTFGAFYAARMRKTAIRETVHHRTRFLREMSAPPTEVDMRVLRTTLHARLHDVRQMRDDLPELYDPDDYSQSQRFGRQLHESGSEGVAYDSVRDADGECVAVYRPNALSNSKQTEHLGYVWDGEAITMVYEKKRLKE
ncbi:MAG TPA: RES family NAD+ phosphorylase [Longimicrobiaceae bacterium]|nr:RES family NAD+ phosphorylase [Longimicrobiaceae bacterium]